MSKLLEEIQLFLTELTQRTSGILAVVLSDREGVVIEQAVTSDCPPGLLTPHILSTLAVASEQASKLNLGNNLSAAVYYTNYQIVHFNCLPFIVSIFARSEANTSLLMSMDANIQETVAPMVTSLAAAL